MKLSEHFTLEEMSITQVRGIDNTPPPFVMVALRETAKSLELVRKAVGDKPIIITSGYRSSGVNKAVGGSSNSAHMLGRAVDFICPGFGTPREIAQAIVESPLQFDQLIEEGTWVHLSFDLRLRRIILTKTPAGGLISGLPEGERMG